MFTTGIKGAKLKDFLQHDATLIWEELDSFQVKPGHRKMKIEEEIAKTVDWEDYDL